MCYMYQTEVVCAFLAVCVLVTSAGPIKRSVSEADKKSEESASKVKDQELALEELAELAAKTHENVAVQKQKTYHYTNVNGQEQSDTESEEKILDPVKQEILLDLKQNTKSDNTYGEEPHKVTVDDIDMPAAGLHKTIVSNGDDTEINDVTDESEQSPSKISDVINFTPMAVAGYLMETGEFEEFEEALAELEQSAGMSHEEAEEYKNNVREEYNKLYEEAEAQAQTESVMEESYPEIMEDLSAPYDTLPGSFYDDSRIPTFDMEEEAENEAALQDAIMEKQSLYEFVKDTMDEWLSQAVLTGNQDAEPILRNILSVVSKDQDPDDLGQVRDVLTELFVDEIMQGIQTRPEVPLEYDDIMNSQFLPSIPQQIVNESPMAEMSEEHEDLPLVESTNEEESAEDTNDEDETKNEETESSDNSEQTERSAEHTEISKEDDMLKLKM